MSLPGTIGWHCLGFNVIYRSAHQKIAELQSQMAIYQTARAAYASALLAELPPTHTVADAEPSNLVH